MQSQLPSELSQAESMLEQHKRKKTEISQLINFTNEEGENIVTRVRQQVSQDAASSFFYLTSVHAMVISDRSEDINHVWLWENN